MHDLLLMRHGQSEWNLAGRMQGRLNSPLTELGQQQARHLAQLLDRLDLSGRTLHCSPQGRALATAGLALGGATAPIRSDDRLMEIDIGAWSGQLFDDIRAAHPQHFGGENRLAWYDAAPGGEGFAGLAARCRSFLEDLSGPAVVVTHGVTLHMLRSLAICGSSVQLAAHGPCKQGVIYHVSEKTSTLIA